MKLKLMVQFFEMYRWSSIAEGWASRDYHLVAIARDKTDYAPDPVSFRDLEEYVKTPLKTIKEMLKV